MRRYQKAPPQDDSSMMPMVMCIIILVALSALSALAKGTF